MPHEAVQIFAAAVSRFGIARGPISHAGLGCVSVQVGYGPCCVMPEWTSTMQNAHCTVIHMAQCVRTDFEELPIGIRRPAGPVELAQLQKATRCFELAIDQLRGKIRATSFAKRLEALRSSFMLKLLDASLIKVVEKCPISVNIDSLPEFNSVVKSEQAEIQILQLQKASELRIAAWPTSRPSSPQRRHTSMIGRRPCGRTNSAVTTAACTEFGR